MATAKQKPIDWEADRRKFGDALQAWRADLGMTRQQAADALRVPLNTFNGWVHGRDPGHETMVRRLMTLIQAAQDR